MFFFIPIPGISKVPFGVIKAMMTNAKEFYAFIDDHIEAHQKNGGPDIPKDFIDQYLIKLREMKVKISMDAPVNVLRTFCECIENVVCLLI